MEDTKEGTLNLMTSINRALNENALDEQQLQDTFNRWWPDLEETLNNLPVSEIDLVPERNEKEILEEILERVRSIGRWPENKMFYLLAPEISKNIKAGWTDRTMLDDYFKLFTKALQKSELQESKLQEKFKEDTKKSEDDSEK